jgi:hypothetical protein
VSSPTTSIHGAAVGHERPIKSRIKGSGSGHSFTTIAAILPEKFGGAVVANTERTVAAEGTSPIVRLITNPVYGAITGICSIIGLPLSIFLYFAARDVPNLSYYESPSRTSIVAAEDTSKLKVQYDGQDIQGNLSAALVTIWNAGRKPILNSDFLTPLTFRMEGDTQ